LGTRRKRQGVPKLELGNEKKEAGRSQAAAWERGKIIHQIFHARFYFPSPCGRGLRGGGEGDFLTFVNLFA
jgi:hypothetical protein